MKKELHKELEDLSPWLAEMKEQPEGYTVPNHFFNNMRVDIMNKVKNEQIPIPAEPIASSRWSNIAIVLKNLWQPRIAIGFASVFVLFGAVYFFKGNEKINVPPVDVTQTVQPNEATQNTNILPGKSPKVEQNTATIVKENSILPVQEKAIPILEEKNESIASLSSEELKPLSLEKASPEDLDAILDELLQNGELNEEDLENIY